MKKIFGALLIARMYWYGNACSGSITFWCKGWFELVKSELL